MLIEEEWQVGMAWERCRGRGAEGRWKICGSAEE